MKQSFFSTIAIGVALGQVATAQDAPTIRTGDPPGPHWVEKPSPQQLADSYPELAIRKDLSGRATMRCVVQATGRVSGCLVIQGTEAPEGRGFGEATLRLARFFRMESDKPLGGTVEIPVVFTSLSSGPAPFAPGDEQRRLDRLRAALDPATTPPLVEPVYSTANNHFASDRRFPELAPIGGYFPDRAQRQGLAGLAVVGCTIAAEAKLTSCHTLGEAPLDFYFGAAAQAMARDGICALR